MDNYNQTVTATGWTGRKDHQQRNFLEDAWLGRWREFLAIPQRLHDTSYQAKIVIMGEVYPAFFEGLRSDHARDKALLYLSKIRDNSRIQSFQVCIPNTAYDQDDT
ncbi:unnamed protein product [Dovyalis caffra]|uniref:Uncharacterized protein n=1 Tax=Dovyalis caffra TaxID=77055 RepID=A0AAV1R9J3_9ROSI|nr:unnamed protein product [Dovyalis caffra]